ncbi:hypothetical protein JP0109_02400 [Helicobacter pylori]|nr:hypothetical protein JP0053_04610 [Helicobacter pylori]GHR62499.1 hypothetical protein JP0103_04230 [Helicobacter pylori]GHR84797.1 hypothetical protein JP0109_02400 [Helicobacter pylori]
MWIAWIDPINQQTTIRDYLKPGSYETLPTKTNFSRLGIWFLKPFYQKYRCFYGHFKGGFNTS